MPDHKLIWLLLATVGLGTVTAYNIDTDFPITLTGDPNSYFGYSLSLMNRNNRSWLIVGAPKANASEFPILREPGKIHKCLINPSGISSCSTLNLDPVASDDYYIDRGRVYKDRKDFGWLGVSVDTTDYNDGRVVACAHRWVNQYYPMIYLVNGICYTIDGDFSDMSFEKLTPLIAMNDQKVNVYDYKYAYAQMGTSAHFIKGSDSLLIGAPGIYDWRGSTVYMSRAEAGIVQKRSLGTLRTYGTVTVPTLVKDIDYTGYFGYAVSSGQFSDSRTVQYVIGAPRNKYRGQVYIVEVKYSAYDVKVDKVGEQMGEYFGSAVCAVDFNNDGLDDLLVGAPLHSKAGDEGKVYVYLNKGSIHLQLMGQGLMGSSVLKARFGSTITKIGDVNMDGFNDVAIGAPFENDQGAVYIYHGGPDGLSAQFQQKITASQVGNNVRGFGMSISRGVDIDHNNYPDIGIGAYSSDQAFLFRSRPLIYLSGTFTPDRRQFNVEEKNCQLNGSPVSCFQVRTCLTYKGAFVPDTIRVRTIVEVDTLKGNESEVVRLVIGGNGKQLPVQIQPVKLTVNKQLCETYDIQALNAPRDYITPIQMKFSYDMIPEPLSLKKAFCPSCPIVDRPDENQKITTIRFMKHCGEDDKCDTDLQLNAKFTDFGPDSRLVIGSRTRVVLHVNIYNAAEPAYATMLIVDVPSWMAIDQKPPMCDFIQKDQPLPRLVCLVANPLKSNATLTMDLNLNVERIPVANGQLEINVTVTSDSNEDPAKRADNNILLTLPIQVEADSTVVGSTVNEQVFYYHDDKGKVDDGTTANFTHIYEISNLGPSRVELVNIEIKYPSPSIGDESNVIQILSIDKRNGHKGVVFGSCEGDMATTLPTGSPESSFTLQPPNTDRRRRRQAVDDTNKGSNATGQSGELKPKEYFHLNCSNFQCKTLKCAVGPFDKETEASLAVYFTVDIIKLQKLMGKLDSAVVVSEGKVTIVSSPSDIQPFGHKPDVTTVSTEVKPGGPPLAKALELWIIIVSVIAGLLLLVIITVVLLKKGFFRRQAKEDMEKLKNAVGNDVPTTEHAEQQSSLME